MQRWLMTILLLSAVLAGCGGKEQTVQATDPFQDREFSVSETTGVLKGVVVDVAIVPLAGVEVSASLNGGEPLTATTDDHGSFAFDNIAPGGYAISASKLGYKPIQSFAEVVANDPDPATVRILLAADPSSLPYYTPYTFDGFIQCNIAGAAVCAVPNSFGSQVTEDHFEQFFAVEGTPTFFQSELIWESTQSVSTRLNYELRTSENGGGYNNSMALPLGESPLLAQVNETVMAANEFGTKYGLSVAVFGANIEGDPTYGQVYTNNGLLSLTIQQKFTFYGHAFYGYTPPETWRFSECSCIPEP